VARRLVLNPPTLFAATKVPTVELSILPLRLYPCRRIEFIPRPLSAYRLPGCIQPAGSVSRDPKNPYPQGLDLRTDPNGSKALSPLFTRSAHVDPSLPNGNPTYTKVIL
jgi:hypothetical protein